MTHVIRLTDPDGAVVYWPKSFGFDSHEFTPDRDAAERMTYAAASRRLNGFLYPPAFWDSERRHAERQRETYRNWRCEVVPA